ncbi:tyrosyl-DNA phosphodiesterase 2-like [Ylistrum balloti]|uniref:tyrosyl-DNA phosphodiesterase 2-like n=1 Tax=Ylistrum balloti TaxID=509963 RepID=UPI002905A31D|nr:tyrosyl-DNA phosphodiesterase 2-like [Ylistrum balloti]
MSPWKYSKAEMKNDEENAGCQQDTQSEEAPDPESQTIRLLSWNIDGLDKVAILERTNAVCDIIDKVNPHAVFLQEVTLLTQAMLTARCPNYQLIPGGAGSYYTCMLLKKGEVEITHDQILPFPDTTMGRNLLIVQCRIKEKIFVLMTSHLESTGECSEERVDQLETAFRMMQKSSQSSTVIFGGDLNLRDQEVASIGGPPPGIYDIWETTGRRQETAFTWDMSLNDNKDFGQFKPKKRFDRLYVRGAEPPVIEPISLEHVGLERVASCGKYPSDHWGLFTQFSTVVKVKVKIFANKVE